MFWQRSLLLGIFTLVLAGCGQQNSEGVTRLIPPHTVEPMPSQQPVPTRTPAPADLVLPTAYPTPTPGQFPADFALVLTSDPAQGARPLHVRLTATLNGGRDDSYELYCVATTWDFDNNEGLTESPACEQWTPAARVSRIYTIDHTYEHSGNYHARLLLGSGPYELRSNVVTIVVQ